MVAAFLQCAVAAADVNLYAYRSFNKAFGQMRTFGEYGVNTIAVFPANTCNSRGDPYCKYPPNWLGIDKYDFSAVDRQFEDFLKANPSAEFIFIADLNSPMWLSRNIALRGGSVECDSFTSLSNCLENRIWRGETSKYLARLLEHVEGKYGSRIKAYLLVCGMTDEWMDYSAYSAGRFKTAAWKRWLAERGEAVRPVPPIDAFAGASFENFLRDPSKEGDIIKYCEFTADVVAVGVSHFAAVARPAIGAKPLGVFFGYINELKQNRLVASGHLSYEKVYADKNIDFFQSPGTYNWRRIGERSGFMCADGTRRRFGKGWLHEIDHFTHMCDPKVNKNIPATSFPGGDNIWRTPADSLAGLKREISLAALSGASMWFFDMSGGWFDTPEMMSAIRRGREIWRANMDAKPASVAEVALIADPQSAFFINDAHPNTAEVYAGTFGKLGLIGAPFDVYSFNDIGNVDMSRYKFFVFPGSFKLDAGRIAVLDKHIFGEGKTALFLYAPAITDGAEFSAGRVEAFTGFKYGAKGVNIGKRGAGRLVYIHSYADATPRILRDLAASSGVKLYVDGFLPVYANERFVAIHTAKGGALRVSLPFRCARVVEAFTGKVAGRDCDGFEYDFASPDTALFEMFRD